MHTTFGRALPLLFHGNAGIRTQGCDIAATAGSAPGSITANEVAEEAITCQQLNHERRRSRVRSQPVSLICRNLECETWRTRCSTLEAQPDTVTGDQNQKIRTFQNHLR